MSSTHNNSKSDTCYLIKKNDMKNFMHQCMIVAGSKQDHANSLASCLVTGDERGHFSHGLNRLGISIE
jgi:LDH2 family malate/lactate/ureidoglycolate dehydrogenase